MDFTTALPSDDEVLSHREAGDFVLATLALGDETTDGAALLRRGPQGWLLLSRLGGTFGAEDLYHLGVPVALWNGLLAQPVSESEREEVLKTETGWPLTAIHTLEDSDFEGLTPYELELMQQEIYARHGKEFPEGALRDYFSTRPWYHPGEFSEDKLNEFERENVASIAARLKSR